jgi:WD40 repeat protein
LITCGNNSSIGAWDIDTGRRVFFILDAHENEEITSIAIDRPCRKFATGSRNGVVKVTSSPSSPSPLLCSSVKIWNSANGQNLHVLPSVEDAEITGILFSDKGVITVGWSRKIIKYPDIISEVRHEDEDELFAALPIIVVPG